MMTVAPPSRKRGVVCCCVQIAQSCFSAPRRSVAESRLSVFERGSTPAERFWPPSLFSSFWFCRFVSERNFPRESPMRLKHLYYRTDNHRVSEWNCDICDTLCMLQRSSITVAQPALSRQIQDLEEEIGFKLFDRLPRGVKISAAGKSFLVDARRILHEVNEAAARDHPQHATESNTF